jgi:hypothetical protein
MGKKKPLKKSSPALGRGLGGGVFRLYDKKAKLQGERGYRGEGPFPLDARIGLA